MRNIQQRLETFETPNWPKERILATPLAIASAGFYYLGERDKVKCWLL